MYVRNKDTRIKDVLLPNSPIRIAHFTEYCYKGGYCYSIVSHVITDDCLLMGTEEVIHQDDTMLCTWYTDDSRISALYIYSGTPNTPIPDNILAFIALQQF